MITYLLFMFSVDPNFEAAKIHGECDRINDAKAKMKMHFGLQNTFFRHLQFAVVPTADS